MLDSVYSTKIRNPVRVGKLLYDREEISEQIEDIQRVTKVSDDKRAIALVDAIATII